MDIVQIVKKSQSEHCLRWAKETKMTDDSKFVESNGATTRDIAIEIGCTNLEARLILNKAYRAGLICKSSNNSGKYCSWWPVGYLAEIKLKQKQ